MVVQPYPRAFVILDDCLYDAGWTKDKLKITFYEW